MKGLSVLALLSIFAFPSPAPAQKIYKCADGSGGNAYQQTPCSTAAETKSVRAYRPAADAPHDYGQYQRQQATPQARSVQTQQATNGQGIVMSGGMYVDMSGGVYDGEAKRRCENLLTLGQRDLWRAQCGGGVPEKHQQNSRTVNRVDSGPKQLVDFQGNTYTQPPGSGFATDNATGEQCLVVGEFVQCD